MFCPLVGNCVNSDTDRGMKPVSIFPDVTHRMHTMPIIVFVKIDYLISK